VESDRVVVLPPTLDEHLRLLQRVEDLAVQQFVPELAVEGLVVAVLPWTARLDEQRLHADPRKPVANDFGCELRTVVTANVIRWPVDGEQFGTFKPEDCANYFTNAGYASGKT
jgi:hypothetical protein